MLSGTCLGETLHTLSTNQEGMDEEVESSSGTGEDVDPADEDIDPADEDVDPADERAGPDNEGDHNDDLCGPIEGPPILGEVTLCSKKGMYVTTQFRPMLIHC